MTHSDEEYQDIFSTDIAKQQRVTEMFSQLLETRSQIIQSMPVANHTGPVHSSNAVQNLSILSNM